MVWSYSQVATVINVYLTMAAVIRYVTTAVEEKFNVLVELDINWLMTKRLVLVRNICQELIELSSINNISLV
jgi:hypothetical protein